jgi:hypothetical protein
LEEPQTLATFLDAVNGDISRDHPEAVQSVSPTPVKTLYFHQLMVVDRHGLSCSGQMREGQKASP